MFVCALLGVFPNMESGHLFVVVVLLALSSLSLSLSLSLLFVIGQAFISHDKVVKGHVKMLSQVSKYGGVACEAIEFLSLCNQAARASKERQWKESPH